MRRRWKVILAVAAAVVLLLALNTFSIDRETKAADVTVEGARIFTLPGGDLQVLDTGPPAGRPGRSPIVLLHCFTCSINWWEELMPTLSRTRRVVAIDLLGHGGSEKPGSGYETEDMAALAAEALGRLDVAEAVVVGHSLGGAVATALATDYGRLVDRLVLIDEAPDNSYGELGITAKLTFAPVIGQLLWRIAPDSSVRDGLADAFAPGFEVPDVYVEDLRRMTFTAFNDSAGGADDYTKATPLDERIRAAGVPLLVIFGAEDQIYDPERSLDAYKEIPGARTELIEDVGHSPNVEAPAATARLILDFAAGS